MNKSIFQLFLFSFIFFLSSQKTQAQDNTWKSPDEDILKILHAPQLPRTSTSPTKTHMVLTDPILYPSLSELGGPMFKMAGQRINPKNNYYHGRHGGTSPRVLTVKTGKTVPLKIPEGAEVISVYWTVNGKKFALAVAFEDRVELWMGDISGNVEKVTNMILCLLYTSPSPRDATLSRMPSSA